MSIHNNLSQQEILFALDIGTRSVVGLVATAEEGQLRVLDVVIEEHTERSMLDGQIHDIIAVADVISKIKQKLEQKHGPLHKVAVAAAGRSLKTKRVSYELPINHLSALTKDDSLTLEFAAVQKAQSLLAQELNDTDITRYYCVGYSVVHYYLDGEVIGNLVDQRGTTAAVDVISTFLPRVVIDSLLAALRRCDLDMHALTLEPIAAIHVLIPSTMRRLNIALVDIGAGTSDIALTEEGTITAYGMVPIAGDEITDALMNAFLLDFHVAEEVKRQLPSQEQVTFTDILGLEQELTVNEIVLAINKDIEELAVKIAHRIIELNGKPPQAVMLIGGGSLTPTLPEKVATHLKIATNRVAVRGADAIKSVTGELTELNGPAFVTPIGIAAAALAQPIRYVTVTINDNQVRLFDLRKMSIGDALLAAGWDMKKLHGRPGLAMSLTVNGRLTIIPGGHGTSPKIVLNGEPAALDSQIDSGDTLLVKAGSNGEDAVAIAKDLLDPTQALPVTINQENYRLPQLVFQNGILLSPDESLADRADLEVRLPLTVIEAVQSSSHYSLLDEILASEPFSFTINNQTFTCPIKKLQVLVNGKEAEMYQRIYAEDVLECQIQTLPAPVIRDVIPTDDWICETVKVYVNEQPVQIQIGEWNIVLDGQPASLETTLYDQAIVHIHSKKGENPIVSDIFRYIEIPPQPQKIDGRLPVFIMQVNGEDASFQSPLMTGDRIQLYWA
ncbi:cell division protein FtsA [Brevibacillus daliensis]|uniref:cell division protein FtsA n=1 Tax=Brevibacillus daliensis TaxID=2892995 RepID=UPI001E6011E8|nr:cell division FtsA domain-containing protein [Brevibacillus daliensis]